MDPEELLRRLQKSKPLSQKRKLLSPSPALLNNPKKEVETSPEANWKRRKSEILTSLQKIQGKVIETAPDEKKKKEPINLNKEEMLMNVQLMNGEIPKTYQDLLLRFKVADIFLRRNHPRMSRINDVNNYMVLSDCKLSFTEKHVQNIVFLYSFSEKVIAYILGRTHPKIPTEHSILTMKLPLEKKQSSVKDQVLTFLGSSRDLNDIFSAMHEEGRKDILQERYDCLEKHIQAYIDEQYQHFLEREEIKPPEKGRVAGFTMKELGEIPLGEIPPPIVVTVKSAKLVLEELQQDVEKAISEKKLPPVSPRKPKGFRKSLDVDFSLL